MRVKQKLIKGLRSDCLLVLFAGWGMDEQPFLPMVGAVDTLIVWDYTTLEPLTLPEDKPVHLIAWSMGVWAATQVLSGVTLASAIAVNGTPTPIDDEQGIPVAVFDGTLATLSEAGLQRFRRRMCGGAEAMKGFMAHAPQRTLDDLHAELAALGEQIRVRPPKPVVWTAAYVSDEDKIFPPAHQYVAFPNAVADASAHWAPALFARLLQGNFA